MIKVFKTIMLPAVCGSETWFDTWRCRIQIEGVYEPFAGDNI
jgi:hypothetical protein